MIQIVIVNAVYPPEPVVSAQMGRDLAVHLAQAGARVTVLCPPPSRSIGADYADVRPAGCPLVRVEDGVEVVRLPSFASPRSRFSTRAWESFSFGWSVSLYLRRAGLHPDVLYVNSWPLLSQAVIARYSCRFGIPMVIHAQDIYPESLLLKLKPGFRSAVTVPLMALDRWIARRATAVITISESVRHTYATSRGIRLDRVASIYNWQDEQLFADLPSRSEACTEYGIPQGFFTFVYLGNIGPVAGVDLLIRSFCRAQLRSAQLLIIGDGSAKQACAHLAAQLRGENIRFIPCPDVRNVPLLQSMADVCLLPMRKGNGLTSIPSKLPAYMFSGKPVLAAADSPSDTARAIGDAHCGWVVEPDNEDALGRQMNLVRSQAADELEQLGKNGRAYGLANYSKSVCLPRLVNVVLSAASRKDAPIPFPNVPIALPD